MISKNEKSGVFLESLGIILDIAIIVGLCGCVLIFMNEKKLGFSGLLSLLTSLSLFILAGLISSNKEGDTNARVSETTSIHGDNL